VETSKRSSVATAIRVLVARPATFKQATAQIMVAILMGVLIATRIITITVSKAIADKEYAHPTITITLTMVESDHFVRNSTKIANKA